MNSNQHEKAAERGLPSQVWRAGQERRLEMIMTAAGDRLNGTVLVDGCGVGMYVEHLAQHARRVIGLDIERGRARAAHLHSEEVLCAAAEHLPFPTGAFDLVLSHEVLEHVQDDRRTIREIVRVLRPGGRLVLFCPNRGYPFETHGVYWRGRYRFGNIPFVNYLPRIWRDRLAPHVEVYTRGDLEILFAGLPVHYVDRRVIFGAYDNIIYRSPGLGKVLRSTLQTLEDTPLQGFGLSHFWVVEKAES